MNKKYIFVSVEITKMDVRNTYMLAAIEGQRQLNKIKVHYLLE